MLHLKIASKPIFMSILSLLIIGAMIFVACAPEDLDYIPTATPVTPTITPTPLPEGVVDPRVEQIEILAQVMPQSFTATTSFDNIVTWRVDQEETAKRRSTPPEFLNGVGLRVFYDDELNQNVEITFAVFSTPEDATNHYERTLDVREAQMSPSQTLDSLPIPNLVGGGSNRGSVAIIQMDEVYFIEVLVTVYDSVRGDPRNGTAEQVVGFWEEAISRFNTPRFKDEQIETVRALIPDQIMTSDEVWDSPAPTDIEGIDFATGFRVRYRSQNVRRDELNITVLAFDLPRDAASYYQNQQTSARGGEVSLSLRQGAPISGIDETNTAIIGSLSNGVAIFHLGEVYYVEVDVSRTTSILDQETLDTASNAALDFINQGIAAFNGATPISDNDTSESAEPTATPAPNSSNDDEPVGDAPEAAEESDTQIIG